MPVPIGTANSNWLGKGLSWLLTAWREPDEL